MPRFQTVTAPFWLLLTLATTDAAHAQATPPEVARDLRAAAIEVRLAAIQQLSSSTWTDADAQLKRLLSDADLEAQLHAALALGERRATIAIRPLVELAVDGEVRAVRHAAATALMQIDANEAASQLWQRAKGKRLVAALEALGVVLPGCQGFEAADKLAALLRHDQFAVRDAAVAPWIAAASERTDALRGLLVDASVVQRCRALEAVTAAPRSDDIAALGELLLGGVQADVVEHRLLRALPAALATLGTDAAARSRELLAKVGDEPVGFVRATQLLARLTTHEPPLLDPDYAVELLAAALVHVDVPLRAAAAKALREVRGEAALATALSAFEREQPPRVRYQLVETIAVLRPPTTAASVAWLGGVARGAVAVGDVALGDDEAVRERAVVWLGRARNNGAEVVLTELLSSHSWGIACCAAVSLGRTEAPAAGAALIAMLRHDDWRRRGAAVIGLMHWCRAEAIEPLIDQLDDRHPAVAWSAQQALCSLSGRLDIAASAAAWREWWNGARTDHSFESPAARREKRRANGYVTPDAELLHGLDVALLPGHNAHTEQLLERLGIAPRMLSAFEASTNHGDGHLRVSPTGLLIVDCAGIVDAPFAAVLPWLVRTGGTVLTTCWGLGNTVPLISPEIMHRGTTDAVAVNGEVSIAAVVPGSPVLDGVFPPHVRPLFHLYGAHPIHVLDTERCDVLIDSPECAERWGCGNLAAKIECGHGVVLDTANHFDLQGFPRERELSRTEERRAFAIEHLGMSFATWRETRTRSYWKSTEKADREIPDSTSLRLLVNLLRLARTERY